MLSWREQDGMGNSWGNTGEEKVGGDEVQDRDN